LVPPGRSLAEGAPSPPEAKKRRTEPISVGRDDGGSKKKSGKPDKSRPGMESAIRLARASNDLKRAKEVFTKKFLARGTLLAKNAKRKKIRELLLAVGGEDYFPVNQEMILGVATALDEAQLQSGDQYIHELKLMHIGAGYERVSPLGETVVPVQESLEETSRPRGEGQGAAGGRHRICPMVRKMFSEGLLHQASVDVCHGGAVDA